MVEIKALACQLPAERGLRVYRREETGSVTTYRIEMEQVVLNATSLMGVSFATEELLAAAPDVFMGLLSRSCQDEFDSHLIYERLNGTGVGQFEGVIGAPATVTISKETEQVADTVLYENIIKMRAAAW